MQFGSDPVANHAPAVSMRQIVHMARILDDLLDVARDHARKDHAPPRSRGIPTNHGRGCRSLPEPDRQPPARGPTVHLPEKPIYLLADPARLEQILVNLLTNAAKYMPSEGRISVAGSVERNSLVLRVRDNGIGISREAPPIFSICSCKPIPRWPVPKGAWASASRWSRSWSRCMRIGRSLERRAQSRE